MDHHQERAFVDGEPAFALREADKPKRRIPWSIAALSLSALACGCGVPKDFVNQESLTAFHNTVSVAAHVKAKCGADASSDTNCKESMDKLEALCAGLDELAKKAGAPGFDCTAWKERS